MVEKKKNPGGRPKGSSKYQPGFDHLAYVACSEGGFTIPRLGKLFGVDKSTIKKWMVDIESFSAAINKGRDEFDCATAENCLLKRIKGYKYKETTQEILGETLSVTKVVEKSVAPDIAGIIFFLRNRNRQRWPDIRTNENTGKDGGPMVVKLSREDELL